MRLQCSPDELLLNSCESDVLFFSLLSEKRIFLTANKMRHPFLVNLFACFQTHVSWNELSIKSVFCVVAPRSSYLTVTNITILWILRRNMFVLLWSMPLEVTLWCTFMLMFFQNLGQCKFHHDWNLNLLVSSLKNSTSISSDCVG